MDFYVHFLCRAYRHSNIVECRITRRSAALAIFAMMENDNSIEPTTAWWDALAAVDEAADKIAARRQRRAHNFASYAARANRIDSLGLYKAWEKKTFGPRAGRRSRRATFA